MPSPKAVLRDIADLGLDPTKAHTLTSKTGLEGGGRLVNKAQPVVLPSAEPKLQIALKQIARVEEKAEEKSPEPSKVEQPKTEEKAPEVPKKVESAVLEEKPVEKPTPKKKVVETPKPEEKKESAKAEASKTEEKPAS